MKASVLDGGKERETSHIEGKRFFPTMISSPVFVEKVLKDASHDYPSFERTLTQLRDLVCFVLAVLGLVHESQMQEIMQLMDCIGEHGTSHSHAPGGRVVSLRTEPGQTGQRKMPLQQPSQIPLGDVH